MKVMSQFTTEAEKLHIC